MNIRLLILIGIMLILVGVLLVSLIQVVMFYMRSDSQAESKEVDSGAYSESGDSKEQIITDLAAENERLKQELDTYKQDDS